MTIIQEKAGKFLAAHGMAAEAVNLRENADGFIGEMERGLKGEESSLFMIPTYISIDKQIPAGERIIVVDKPHFLATMPRGMWYRQTALIRLRERLGEPDITPAHRLDRMTAGVLVFVRDSACRGAYQMLFQNRQAVKIYECLAPCRPISGPRFGTIMQVETPRPVPLLRRSHITKEHGTMAAFEEPGLANAETLIERGDLCFPPAGGRWREAPEGGPHPGNHPICRYTLHPRTGKTHQLRVHMNSLGLPIVGDDFYPRIQTRPYDDFSQPLQLVARVLRFTDPITGEKREFVSRVPLKI